MGIFVVVAHDLTGYRLVKAFSKESEAEKYRMMLKELCWRGITIEHIFVDSEVR